MSDVSAAPALMNAMQTALAGALSSPTVVTSAWVEPTSTEHVMLLEVPAGSQEWVNIGNRARKESGTIAGTIFVVAPGAGETVIRAARARAYAILGKIEALLVTDPTWGGVVIRTALVSHSCLQAPQPNRRACEIPFDVTYEARLES